MTAVVRIGTRGSELATTQAGHVRDAFIAAGLQAELVIITTDGDTSQRPVEEIGVGVFTQALREAMARGEVDCAVHSFKDLPTAADDRFVIAAIPTRKDPSEVLIAKGEATLDTLPDGAVIGTSAPRRIAQLKALNPSFDIRPLRGNIDTRIGRVHTVGDLDAVILAKAGLVRTGRDALISQTLDPAVFLPAPAQGALAVEVRADKPEIIAAARTFDSAATRLAVVAERSLLAALEAGCTAPVGVHSRFDGDYLYLTGGVFGLDGARQEVLTLSSRVEHVDAAKALGHHVAQELIDRGAAQLMA